MTGVGCISETRLQGSSFRLQTEFRFRFRSVPYNDQSFGSSSCPVHVAISIYLIVRSSPKDRGFLKVFSFYSELSGLKKASQTPQPHFKSLFITSNSIPLAKEIPCSSQCKDEGKYILPIIKLYHGHSCVIISKSEKLETV